MFLFELLNLGEGFKKYFEVVPGLTEDLKCEAYRIRHKVYCEELGWEPRRPDGMEQDAYDAHSLHVLIRAKSNGEYVGCTRLVCPPADEPGKPLPVERACAATLDPRILDTQALPRRTVAEVSRLAVISRYRRREGEANQPAPISDDSFGTQKQPRFPYIPVGLYLGMISMAQRHGIETLLVLTEPRLASHLGKLGVKVTRIGGPIEHRGTRVPSVMSVSAIIKHINFVVRPMYNVIARDMDDAMARLGTRPPSG